MATGFAEETASSTTTLSIPLVEVLDAILLAAGLRVNMSTMPLLLNTFTLLGRGDVGRLKVEVV